MKKVILLFLASLFVVTLVACGVEWAGTGTVQDKYHKEAYSKREFIGKTHRTVEYPECWGIILLDDKYYDERYPEMNRSPEVDNRIRAENTEFICIPKEKWDTLNKQDKYTIQKEAK